MSDGITTFQLTAFEDVEMCSRLEEERTAEEGTFGNDNHASAVGGSLVDNGLNGRGLDDGTVAANAVVSNHILLAKLIDFRSLRVVEPCRNCASVRKILELCMNTEGKSRQQREHYRLGAKFHNNRFIRDKIAQRYKNYGIFTK